MVGDLFFSTKKSVDSLIRLFKKADFVCINTIFCNIDWISLFNNNVDVSGCVDTFYNVSRIEEYTPIKSFKSRHYPIWFSHNTINLLKLKNKYHKRWRKYGSYYDNSMFAKLRSDCRSSIDSDYSSYVYNSENSIINCPKRFWSFVHSNKKDSCEIPDKINWQNESSENSQETSEMFADYFESVYSDSQFVQPEAKNFYGTQIDSLFVSYEDVYKRLCELKDDSSSGPDDIPPILLKNCAFSLTFPLTTLFNISLQSGMYPTSWKTSFVVPIYKTGDKSQAKNYRPICKNSTIAQIFDSIVTEKLTDFFISKIAA